jgi:hypothetical protein
VKSALIRIAVAGAGGVFVYLLGGGRGPSFLAGVILSVAFRRWGAINAKYDRVEPTRQTSERNPSPADDDGDHEERRGAASGGRDDHAEIDV